jgi:formylglycine-generating enzyme
MPRISMIVLVGLLVIAGVSEAESDFQPTEEVLIPGGEFLMGVPDGKDGLEQHTVRVNPFHMDTHEVTNAQYLAFCQATDRKLPIFWDLDRFRSGPDFPDHPIVGVSNNDAKAYALWCGRRLPTEAEWEFAARGGLSEKKYDTGDDLPETEANTKAAKLDGPVAVKSFRPNAYGLYDMVGNVREWVSDYYSDEYFSESPVDNPTGPAKGKQRVVKGGGWFSGTGCNRVHVRNALTGSWSDFNVGFRCVRDAGEQAGAEQTNK